MIITDKKVQIMVLNSHGVSGSYGVVREQWCDSTVWYQIIQSADLAARLWNEEEMKGNREGRKGLTQAGRAEKRKKSSGRQKVGSYVLVFFNTVMLVYTGCVHVCVEPYPM